MNRPPSPGRSLSLPTSLAKSESVNEGYHRLMSEVTARHLPIRLQHRSKPTRRRMAEHTCEALGDVLSVPHSHRPGFPQDKSVPNRF